MTEYTDHHGPTGLRTRGTIVVVPGRGETRATYGRLARRLAADAYRVRVADAPDVDVADLPRSLAAFAAALTTAARDTAPDGADDAVRPVVVIGADTGALALAALLGRAELLGAWRPDGVVLAGLPGETAAEVRGWDDELDVRTSCPAHRGTLTEDTLVRRGTLDDAVPGALLDAAYGVELPVPALLLTGDADPLADPDTLRHAAKTWGRTRLAVVRGAHHDVLNDLQHRSVAAEVVTFLEALREGLVPLVAVETSAW
jgi:alpha-beta hydrolase superfamily lysophospholipase